MPSAVARSPSTPRSEAVRLTSAAGRGDGGRTARGAGRRRRRRCSPGSADRRCRRGRRCPRSSWPTRRACPRPTRTRASAHRSTTAAGPCGRFVAAANMPAPRSGEPTARATSATPCPDWSQRTGIENKMAPVVVFTSILAGSMLSSSPPSDQITSVTLLPSPCPRALPAAPGVSLRRVGRSSRIDSRCSPGGNGSLGGLKMPSFRRRAISRTTSRGAGLTAGPRSPPLRVGSLALPVVRALCNTNSGHPGCQG